MKVNNRVKRETFTDPLASLDAPIKLLPLTLEAWRQRELQNPDFLLGSALSTTNRWLVAGPTGIGKTNLAISLGMSVAAGDGFLHWIGYGNPRTVLYVDGEMSRRVVRQRLIAEIKRRSGDAPDGFHALCAEDVEEFPPLNTAEGRQFMWKLIEELGNVDLIIFDNIMSLLAGNMAEEGAWAEVMPFVRSLTRRNIGQIWIHHMGHDAKKAYGTKTREWQLDTVVLLEKVERADTDVSFKMSFDKARERAPSNRDEFQDVEVALVEDRWEYRAVARSQETAAPSKVSPKAQRFLGALIAVASTERGVTDDVWKTECHRLGLIDLTGKADSARSLFSKHKRELVDAKIVAFENGLSWVK